MKEGWTYKKLGEVCDIVGRIGFRGYTRKDYVNTIEEGAISLSPSNIINNQLAFSNCTYITWDKYNQSPEIMISKGDVVFVKTASVGKCAYVSELPHESTINPQFVVFKNVKISNRFLFLQLISPAFQFKVKRITTGTSVPTITQKGLSELEVSYPPFDEQERIVDYLDAAFAQIDELKANSEKQLADARALFQSALTEAMQPKPGWQKKKLPDISENLDSRRIPITQKNRVAGPYPYYGASGIVDYVNDFIFDESLLCISEDGANLLMRTYPIAFPISGKVWVNNHAHVLRFDSKITQDYVEYFFASIRLDEYITGAAQPKLTQKALNSIPVFLPTTLEEQSIVVTHLDTLSSRVHELEDINRKTVVECDALKQALLRQVFE